MHTQEAATQMRCQSAAHPRSDGFCVGRVCMAWRWSREKETAAFLADVKAYMQAHNVNFNVATQKVWAEKAGTYAKSEGYCGLAGTPS